jgi:hypothetical protein
MRKFARLPDGADPAEDVMCDLIYGWGNELWSVQPEYLKSILHYAWHAPGPILECGSGLSTLLLGLVAKRTGNKLWVLEHNPVWAERVRAALIQYDVTNVEICASVLSDYGAYAWYTPSKESMPSDFSVVVCDGPPGDTPGGRYGLLPVMRSHLRAGCVILLDDTDREPERQILARWSEELGVPHRMCGSKNPFGIMTLPS